MQPLLFAFAVNIFILPLVPVAFYFSVVVLACAADKRIHGLIF